MNTYVAAAKERLVEWQEVKASLPPARERLSEQAHRLRRVEACVDEVEQKVRALESFTLTGLIDSLLGQKQRKLDERRAELEEFEKQLKESESAFTAVEQQVQALEAQLAQLEGAEAAFGAACEQQAQVVLASGGAAAAQLHKTSEELAAAQAVFRTAQKAMETGRQLSKHLESLERAVRNAKHNKAMSGSLRGAVGSIIKESVASMGPKSAIRYVADAAQRFVCELGELPLTDHQDDVDLARIRAELETFHVRLTAELSGFAAWEQIETLPVQQQVREALSHLKDWSNELQPTVAALEQQRHEIIERS
jgi:hypothetical protein